MAPAPIENKLKEEILIEQAMVVGEGRKFVSAIILPAKEPLNNYCVHKNVTWEGLKQMLEKPLIQLKYQKMVDTVNSQLAKYEQIKKFLLLDDEWLPIRADGSEGELTPSLKLKRRRLEKKYAREIDELYLET